MAITYMTEEGYKKLMEEIAYLENVKNGAVMTYTIVSESEANLREGKISATTPIAKGLLGKKVGDIAEIQVPSGLMSFEIVDISI